MGKGTLYLFDTTVLLALVRGKDLGRYIERTFGLSEVINKPLISVVSHGEIWAMADRNAWGDEKRQALSEMLSDLLTLDLNDLSIIEAYVDVDRKNLSHPQDSRALSDNDKWIAATARAAGAVLLFQAGDAGYATEGSAIHGESAYGRKASRQARARGVCLRTATSLALLRRRRVTLLPRPVQRQLEKQRDSAAHDHRHRPLLSTVEQRGIRVERQDQQAGASGAQSQVETQQLAEVDDHHERNRDGGGSVRKDHADDHAGGLLRYYEARAA